MNEEEFRKYEIKRIAEKYRRLKQIQPATYTQPLPELMWEYVTAADSMFIDGHFMGVILLCAATIESLLADQLMVRTSMTREELERFSLEQMNILALRLGILTEQEKKAIDELKGLRNALIHANAGRISKMARRHYGSSNTGLETEFYLSPISNEGGICDDSLKYLRFTRDLTLRFYGELT